MQERHHQTKEQSICVHIGLKNQKNTFCSSWDPEYFAEMDLISPPNAEAQSFTLTHKINKKTNITLFIYLLLWPDKKHRKKNMFKKTFILLTRLWSIYMLLPKSLYGNFWLLFWQVQSKERSHGPAVLTFSLLTESHIVILMV